MGGLRSYDKLKQTWIQKQNQLMKKFAIGCAVIGVVVVLFIIIFGLAGIGGYNRLVSQSQNVDKQWAQVQNDYQRRADLITSRNSRDVLTLPSQR